MPVSWVVVDADGSLNEIILIAGQKTFIHQHIGMIVHDGAVAVKGIHGPFSLIFHHFQRFLHIAPDPGGRYAVDQDHGKEKGGNQKNINFCKGF